MKTGENMRKLILILFLVSSIIIAQDKKEDDKLSSSSFGSLKFRSIGPAWNSGRISDFAVNPNNFKEYYVATASGNLWKTTNGGITYDAVADTLPYSLGCVVIDPNNPFVVWVGSGENNHQRALGYGDGVYKSTDGGKSWKNMGLRESRQIGGILVDPRNSDIVYVAAEGSVWGPGGDRGLYKTTDGGKSWNKSLNISENTGVNNIICDPRNPDILFATSEQRRRHIYTKIGGGPESAVYKSTNAGATWDKIMSGLPGGDIGGMGIAVSPVNPDVIYLSMEAAENKGGFFRSTNRGASWDKMSDEYASGQYFNEIFCDPVNIDKIYIMDVVSKFTLDAGKTWKPLSTSGRHVDDHAFWINPKDTEHLLIGGDGGIYESMDGGINWEFKANLPVTQFYRVNVDNSKPFYYVYGGTQDNQSMGGPSQTINEDGIVNSDWFMTVGGDGFFQAIDPTDKNIVYSEWQYGNIIRFDRRSGETVSIRPEPLKGEKSFRWYWDTPFFISPFSHTRLYIAAERVFKSDDRGESWQAVSGDLTTGTDRNSFKVMDKYWSSDAVAKDVSTSQFGLIVSLIESPLKENMIFAGTDDGLIQVTEDLVTWRKISDFPDVPKFTLVSDILPSRFDENVVYATFNNHKQDDFRPYVLKSNNKGKSWESIAGNLPSNGAVNTIVEDPVNKNLLFVGTEWGVFFTVDGGNKWIQLKAGLPKVKVPDIVIHEGEKDLVIATFGRGFYILDDYSPLREVSREFFDKDSYIFPINDATMFHKSDGKYGQGATYFKADNPDFGATFTYYLKDVPKTLKAERKEKEKELFKKGEPIPQPAYEQRKAEEAEIAPYLTFVITDETGSEVRRLNTSAGKGIGRINWDLRYDHYYPVNISKGKYEPTAKTRGSLLALPGKYGVTMYMTAKGMTNKLFGPVEFKADILNNVTLPAADRAAKVKWEREAMDLARVAVGTIRQTEEINSRMLAIRQTAATLPGVSAELFGIIEKVQASLDDILFRFKGEPAKASQEEVPPAIVPLNGRLGDLLGPTWSSSGNITKNQKVAYEILREQLPGIISDITNLSVTDIPVIERELENLKAPWTPGRIPQLK